MLDKPLGAKGRSMPTIQGLSKAAGNYRRADYPKFSCMSASSCFPVWRSAGAGTSAV